MNAARTHLLAAWPLCLLLGGAACGEASSPETVVPIPEEPSPRVDELELDDRRTTNPVVAVANLEASIAGLRERLEARPRDREVRGRLLGQLEVRAAFLGRYDDFVESERLTAEALELFVGDPRWLVARAGHLGTVHRFDEALDLLDGAEALGAEPTGLERQRIVLRTALGEPMGPLVARAEALVALSDRYDHWTVLAATLSAAGRYEEADAAYVRALGRYRDVSPFALAWVSFVRGVMWSESAGRADLGERLYRDALARLPSYVVANVHLSELESPDAAVARLTPLAQTAHSSDPEPAFRVAERMADSPAREVYVTDALQRYEVLLARDRGAFLDHAAEFFGSAGADLPRAQTMALENLSLRPTPRAYQLAIQTSRDAGDLEGACRLRHDARDAALRHAVLQQLLTTMELECAR